jgi:hypothetical protein
LTRLNGGHLIIDENKIVAALLTVASHAHFPEKTGNDRRAEVMQTYEYFLEQLGQKQAESIPKPLKDMVDSVRKKQLEREKAKTD